MLAVIAATIIQHFGDMRFAVTPSFVCAVMVSGWFGGMGPGLLSTALSILALKYYFVPPTGTFAIDTAHLVFTGGPLCYMAELQRAQGGDVACPCSLLTAILSVTYPRASLS